MTKREVIELLIEVFDGCRVRMPDEYEDQEPCYTVDHDLLMDYLVVRSEQEAVKETT